MTFTHITNKINITALNMKYFRQSTHYCLLNKINWWWLDDDAERSWRRGWSLLTAARCRVPRAPTMKTTWVHHVSVAT